MFIAYGRVSCVRVCDPEQPSPDITALGNEVSALEEMSRQLFLELVEMHSLKVRISGRSQPHKPHPQLVRCVCVCMRACVCVRERLLLNL